MAAGFLGDRMVNLSQQKTGPLTPMNRKIARWASRLIGMKSGASQTGRIAGDAARDRRDWITAAENYRRHLQTHPRDFAILVQLGHALREGGNLDGASEAYRLAKALRPDDPDLLLHSGHLARRMGELDAARLLYQASLAIDGNSLAQSALDSFTTSNSAPPPTINHAGAIDSCIDGILTGWAIDADHPGQPVELEILADGNVVATGRTAFPRSDVAALGLGQGPTGFRIDTTDRIKSGATINVRVRRTGEPLRGGPIMVQHEIPAKAWLARNEGISDETLEIIRTACDRDAGSDLMTILASISSEKAPDISRLTNSVLAQWCSRWELVLITDQATSTTAMETAHKEASRDQRIRVAHTDANWIDAGIAAGLGTSVVIMGVGQTLEPEAVHRLLDAHATGAQVAYCDEAVVGTRNDDIRAFRLRPALAPEYFISHPDLITLFSLDMQIARGLDTSDTTLAGNAVRLELLFRAIDNSKAVSHVPAVLYRGKDRARGATMDIAAAAGVVRRRLARLGSHGVVAPDAEGGGLAVSYPDPGGTALIVIPTKDRIDLLRTCLESIWRTCDARDIDIVVIDHQSIEPQSQEYLAAISDRVTVMPYSGAFNFARMNNAAVATHGRNHPFIVFMNNDIEAIKPGWLQRLRSLAGQKDIGVVGVNLLYSDRTIQHSGVIVGLSGAADHGHRQAPYERNGRRLPGLDRALIATREYSAVTAACMMVPTALFHAAGGFDEELAIGFNDTDLCLRIGSTGRRILNDGQSVLYHHESATRAWSDTLDHPRDSSLFTARWHAMISWGDPFYSPLMSTRRANRPGNLADMHHPPRMALTKPALAEPTTAQPRRIASISKTQAKPSFGSRLL